VLGLPQESRRVADQYSRPVDARIAVGGIPVQRILIVEDSATMRSLLASTLEELASPVKVLAASNGFEALRLLPREEFDLVVTDINMPEINGLELVSFVKSNDQYRDIPLIIVSTEGSEKDREKGMQLGADAYVVKPFEPEALREVAQDLLSRNPVAK
jgi:two-component system chemotaxis response regulator CheY